MLWYINFVASKISIETKSSAFLSATVHIKKKNPPNGKNMLFIYLDNLLPVDSNLASKTWRYNLDFVSISPWLNLI